MHGARPGRLAVQRYAPEPAIPPPLEHVVVMVTAGQTRFAGRKDEAGQTLRTLQALSAQRYISSYDLAMIQVGLGDRDAALNLLEQGYRERTHWMALLQVDPRLDPLRSDPRFARLLEAMRFPG